MAVDTTQFDREAEFGPVTKLQRTVQTPMPKSTEENRQVVYEVGDYLVKVSKVSEMGWTVTRYEGDTIDRMYMDYYDQEEAAHDLAREMVEEVA